MDENWNISHGMNLALQKITMALKDICNYLVKPSK